MTGVAGRRSDWAPASRPAALRFHLRRHLAIWRQVLVQAVGRETQFRAQAFTTIVTGLLQLGTGLAPVLLMYHYTDAVRGWSAGEVIVVVGLFQTAMSLLDTFVAPNLSRMTRYIAHGELDLVLVRPVSAQAYTLARWIQPAELPGVGTGLAVTAAGIMLAHLRPDPLEWLTSLTWFVLGLIAVTCLWANLAYLAFRFSSIDPVELLRELLASGRYPLAFFPRAARAGLIFVVPVGVCTTLPIRVLTGHVDAWWLGAGTLLVAADVALTRLHWRLALRRYSSASS